MDVLIGLFFQAHMHHYTEVEGMEASLFTESLESLTELISEYHGLETMQPQEVPRLQTAS